MLIKRGTFAVTLGGLSARHLPKSSGSVESAVFHVPGFVAVAECSNPGLYHTYSKKTVSFQMEKSCSAMIV